jgi:hypothetical protein
VNASRRILKLLKPSPLKLKLKHPFFTGCEYVSGEGPGPEKPHKVIRTPGGGFYLREFELKKNQVIKVANVFKFYDLVRFYYKGYCCVINQNNIIIK